MGRCRKNQKPGAGKKVCMDASPDLLQQDGELEVGVKGSVDSPESQEHFTFNWRMTMDGVATAHSSGSLPHFSITLQQSDTALFVHPSDY